MFINDEINHFDFCSNTADDETKFNHNKEQNYKDLMSCTWKILSVT
jgi:hypothetical protein